mmetsp:Transcript_18604/g.27761  ORF Transcript_18604/g.27761 Transcript_18604/m.27761 type:complete len:295 (+) Transcript_18604:1-885(+)
MASIYVPCAALPHGAFHACRQQSQHGWDCPKSSTSCLAGPWHSAWQGRARRIHQPEPNDVKERLADAHSHAQLHEAERSACDLAILHKDVDHLGSRGHGRETVLQVGGSDGQDARVLSYHLGRPLTAQAVCQDLACSPQLSCTEEQHRRVPAERVQCGCLAAGTGNNRAEAAPHVRLVGRCHGALAPVRLSLVLKRQGLPLCLRPRQQLRKLRQEVHSLRLGLQGILLREVVVHELLVGLLRSLAHSGSPAGMEDGAAAGPGHEGQPMYLPCAAGALRKVKQVRQERKACQSLA